MARLDRLASVRLVAQIGAAIGREFSYALLRVVSRLSARRAEGCARPPRRFRTGLPARHAARRGYAFKHALVQDAAHSGLLHSSRQQLHARIGDALEAHFPELTDSQPELLAQHYAEARLVEKPIADWGKAGREFAARSAMAEAAAQLQKGLDQLALRRWKNWEGDMNSFDGLCALITGSASGLGAATAVALAHRGARVIINSRASAGEADETAISAARRTPR